MPTENDVKKAYEEGLTDGTLAERKRLRAFTGLRYVLAPRVDLPEHRSYPDYERRLRHEIVQAEQETERIIASRVRAEERSDSARETYHQVLDSHREDREDAGFLGKVISRVKEPFLKEKANAEAAENRVFELITESNDHSLKLHTLRGEYAAVSEWVDEMYSTTEEAGRRRAEDRIAAGRDISSRRFKVFTMGEYLDGDEHRRLRWQGAPDVPGGADFGYHWRRDGDDDPSLYSESQNGFSLGNWRAVWIEENHETAVFISEPRRAEMVWMLGNHIQTMGEAMEFFSPLEERQAERNSLALLLDAYTKKYLKGNN